MDADDLLALYKLVRGNKSATVVMDAHSAFVEKRISDARRKLMEAREKFADSRSRILRQDLEKQVDKKAKDFDRQLKKLQRKKEKVVEALEAFDELLPQLEKLAARQARDREEQSAEQTPNVGPEPSSAAAPNLVTHRDPAAREHASSAESVSCLIRPRDLTERIIREFNGADDSERLDLIGRNFGFHEIVSEDDIHGDAVYFIRTDKYSFLVQTPHMDEIGERLQVQNLSAGGAIKPFSRERFVDLGRQRKMVLLTRRDATAGFQSNDLPDDGDAVSEPQSSVESADVCNTDVLDMGAFSQLLTSAQRSGLVPSADQVGHVRDREFRLGKYDEAFQTINGLFSQFMSAATQRTQRIAREDADISAGRVKISPKDLLAKRARDRAQTQEVDRAQRRFQIVLEGLRVLMSRSS